MTYAMGILGVDGPFRQTAERTLDVMRKNKDVLIALLDTFLYDPLAEWTQSVEGEKEKKKMNLNMNLKLLSSRIGMSSPLTCCKTYFLNRCS
jgi:phosphatidylinositol kinase/protein kinase (PI-3  family)